MSARAISTNDVKPGNLLSLLEGEWSFERIISGHGEMAGAASFHGQEDNSSIYSERGQLQLSAGGSRIEAYRQYIFAPTSIGFDVYFDENPRRLFHNVKLEAFDREICGATVHLCVNDEYRTIYRFGLPTTFSIQHRVRGPKKDYTMDTKYWRANASTA